MKEKIPIDDLFHAEEPDEKEYELKKQQLEELKKQHETGEINLYYGDGSGFLYYFDSRINTHFKDIIVGSGIDWLGKSSHAKPNEQATKERIRKYIENKILGIK